MLTLFLNNSIIVLDKQYSGDAMEYNFDNERPIYIQLIKLIEREIVSGRLKSGERIPSVREYANSFKVNPNTMQKALMELEKEGLIYTERTNGKYITEDTELIKKVKDNLALELVNDFMVDMNNIGISSEEIIKYLEKER